jgi:hypothetical protein
MASHDSLQLHEDLRFQAREWRWQRLGRWLLLAFVVAAAAGLFGGGPLSSAVASADGGALNIEYERFARAGAAMRLSIEDRAAAQPVAMRVNRAYFDQLRIDRITPEPTAITIESDDAVLLFDRVGVAPFTIVIDGQLRRPGRLRATVRTAGAAAFSQFVIF